MEIRRSDYRTKDWKIKIWIEKSKSPIDFNAMAKDRVWKRGLYRIEEIYTIFENTVLEWDMENRAV